MADRAVRDVHERRIRRAALVGAACAWLLFLGVLTQDGGLLHRDTFGNFYAAQADALNHGHWDVDPHEVAFEGFLIDGKTYLYFGPVPAVVRMPIEAVTSRFHGRLTRLSMLGAQALLLWFVIRLLELSRRSFRARAPAGRFDALMSGLFVFAAGTSSTLFLAGQSWVYHEALLWGAALTIGSLTMLAAFLQTRRPSQLVWSGALAVLAVNTRAVTGGGALVALGFVGLVELRTWIRTKERPPRSWLPVAIIAGSLLLSVAWYAAVNKARFGSFFGLPLDKQVLVRYDTQRQQILAANHNSMFGAKFLPTQVFQAVRPDALQPTRLFPFVDFPVRAPRVFGDALVDTRDPTSSITASQPALAILSIVGVVGLVWSKIRRRLPDARGWGILTVGAACSTVGFISINYVSNRYLTDALPFLVVAGVVGLQGTIAAVRRKQHARFGAASRWGVAGAALVLVGSGAWINASLGVQYHEVTAPGASPASRAGWLSLQLRIDEALHGSTPLPHVSIVDQLPPTSTRGELAIVGRCRALYRSYGTGWALVEGGPSATASARDRPVCDRLARKVEHHP